MEKYTSLAEAKKSLIRQVSVLFAAAFVICLAGRLLDRGSFGTGFILDYLSETPDIADYAVEWEGEEMAVEDFEVFQAAEGDLQARVMRLRVRVEKPGSYSYFVMDKQGNPIRGDVIRVGPLGGAVSWSSGSFTGDEAVIFAGIVVYLALAVIMAIFYHRLRGELACSYEAILACGVFLFSLVVLIIEIPVYVRHLVSPELYPTLQLLIDIASGGKNFVMISFPVITLLGGLLIISNVELLRHERPRFRNVLGLLLGAGLIIVIWVYITWYNRSFSGSFEEHRIRNMVENILGVVFTYAECTLLGSVICGLRAARHVPPRDRDYIVILGCGFRKDGTLPPLLRGRVDKALEFWHRQKEETGKEAFIIPSGGQGAGEPMAEAEAMYRYIVDTGFPEERVIKEDRSANTYQNMEFSKRIIASREENPDDVKAAFSTTNYHVFRSGIWAGLAGFKAEGMGSRTKWWFWPNAFVRECVGLLRNRIVSETVFLIILIGLYGLLTWFLA